MYTQKKSFFTSVFGDRPSFRAKRLQREPGNRYFTSVFGHFVRKGCNGNPEIAILPQFLAIEPQRAKGLQREPGNRNFTSVFDDRPSFRAKGLQREPGNRNFTSVFDDRTSFRAKGLRGTP